MNMLNEIKLVSLEQTYYFIIPFRKVNSLFMKMAVKL